MVETQYEPVLISDIDGYIASGSYDFYAELKELSNLAGDIAVRGVDGSLPPVVQEETRAAASRIATEIRTYNALPAALTQGTQMTWARALIIAIDSMPGPFRKAATPFTHLLHRYSQGLKAATGPMTQDMFVLMHNKPTVWNWTYQAVLRDIARHHGPGTATPSTPPAPQPISTTNLQTVQQEINHVKLEIKAIVDDILSIEARLATIPTGSNVPSWVGSEIGGLQNAVKALTANQAKQADTLNHLNARQTQLEHRQDALADQIGGVSAVTTTFPIVVNALNAAVNNVIALVDTILPELATQTAKVNQLSPLAVLLLAGPKGLNTLRKLQRNPCQCPPPSNMTGDAAIVLALDQAVLGNV